MANLIDISDILRPDLSREERIALLRSGVWRWNAWREAYPDIRPNLAWANLDGANLREADLREADLEQAKLSRSDLSEAILLEARLFLATLEETNLNGAMIAKANLRGAHLHGAHLEDADLTNARLRKAILIGADLRGTKLTGADLTATDLEGANLSRSDLIGAHLEGANLAGANLAGALLIGTSLVNTTLDGCRIFGISAWDVRLDGATQTNLNIMGSDELTITVDDLRVAQFLYLLLNNQEIRAVIDTLTSKVVLILGRFTEERKPVLEAVRDALRQQGYVPVLFDFSGPDSRNVTETVTLLARMARFIIADLTDPGSIPYELAKIVPDVHVPIQPLLLAGTSTFAMAGDLWMAREMLPVFHYTTPRELLAALPERVIEPAEAKVTEIQRVRAAALLNSGLPR